MDLLGLALHCFVCSHRFGLNVEGFLGAGGEALAGFLVLLGYSNASSPVVIEAIITVSIVVFSDRGLAIFRWRSQAELNTS